MKNEFINWLLKNPRHNYYNNDKAKLEEALDHYNTFFDRDIYDASDIKELKRFLQVNLYDKPSSEFLHYSLKTSNHLPRAILGNKNYIKFLNEKLNGIQPETETKAYTWVKTHLALAKYLKDFQNKQEQLIDLLKFAGCDIFGDKESEDINIELNEIDPFTFFCYIYKYGDVKRLKVLQAITKQIDIHYPKDELGIPSANAQKVWMFPWKYQRNNDEIETLWQLFFQATNQSITDELFQKALKIQNVGKTKITEALFYVDPINYFPINGPTKPYLKEVFNIDHKFKSFEDYKSILSDLRTQTEMPFYQLSYEAWLWNEERSKIKNNSSTGTKYWLYAPGRNAEYWNAFYNDGIMAIGWDAMGDLNQYKSKEDIFKALKSNYGGDGDKKNNVTANYEFANTINIGDIIIVKKGRGELLGYGEVVSDYYHDGNRTDYKSCRKVNWKLKGNWQTNFSLVLKTLTNITKYPAKNELYNTYYENLIGIMESKNKDIFQLYKDYLTVKRRGQIADTTIEGYVESASKEITNRWNKLYNDNFKNFVVNYDNLLKINPLLDPGFTGSMSFVPFLRELKDSYRVIVEPSNKILYGPPGTGKTYTFKQEYFPLYTTKETSITSENNFENVVKGCSWWEVIAVALIQLGESKVNDIHNHRWVQKKAELSNTNTVKPTLWGQLQRHTIETCTYVNVKSKLQPLIFNKTENSTWQIIKEEVDNQIPELYQLIDKVENFKPNPDKLIERFKFVTFHQSFSYEDFIEGIKPIMPENDEVSEDLGYKIEDGVFKDICNDARLDPDNRYAIFIDELNRGNVSAIFGELITLIEIDKRKGAKNELSLKLPYSKKEFSVPLNLDIYGTMNTADRSVESLDTALRRRFEFKEMMPDYSVIANEEVGDYKLSDVLETINERIELLIDRDHTIGHSYFVNVTTEQQLANAFKNKIVPLLQEYFYGDYGKIGLVLGKGFVKRQKNDDITFSSFKYDGKDEFITPTYKLKPIDASNILDAVKQLLQTKDK